MSEALLQVAGLGKRFGGFVALDDISLAVQEGERVGLIGPNGSGKSTLVNCLSGILKHDSGQVRFDGHAFDGLPAYRRTRLGLARSFQLPKPFRGLTVVQNLHVPLLFTAKHRAGSHLSTAEIDTRCAELLHMVALESKAEARPRDLTQIEMRKLELARAMAAAPKLLIADEPMAGLSHSEVDDILALLVKLNQSGVTVILIEHIMRAVMGFSERLVCLVAGKKIADGTPREVVHNPDVERAYLGQ
jgi:branched-chain amino acid transport system ATP-binding protein